MTEPTQAPGTTTRAPLTPTEKFAWVLLVVSLLVGFGLTAFAPT